MAITPCSKLLHLGIVTLLMVSSFFAPFAAVHASSMTLNVALSTTSASTATDIIFTFTLVNAVAANGYINIHFPTGTTIDSGLDYTDVDVLVNGTNRTLNTYSTSTFSGYDGISINVIDPNNLLLQIVPESTGSGYAAGDAFTVKIGTNASHQHTGDKRFINGSSTGAVTYEVVSRNVSNEEIDRGSKNITITAVAPEFGTIAYTLAMTGGAWMIFKKMNALQHT